MLRCIGACTLPREPRQVCLLHHYVEGLVISAVRYNAHAYLDTEQGNTLCYPTPATTEIAETNKDGTNEEVDETSNYFTVVEAAIPLSATQVEAFTTVSNNNNNKNLPSVRTITVPVPGVAVHALTLLHRESGREVYVLVQCATEKDDDNKKKGFDTAAYVFRRVLMHSSSEEEDEDNVKEGHHGTGIRYVRMPRPVDDEHRIWSALTTLDGELLHHEHNNSASNSRTTVNNGSASQTSSQASTSSSSAAAGVVLVVAAAEGKANVDPALQVFAVSATRAERYATCALPSLAGLSITQLVPCTGKPGHLLLLCPHLIAEVTLSVSQDERMRVLVRPTRVWRCSPSDVLLVCTLKEHYLYAGTAQGTLLLWDTHLTTTSDNTSNSEKPQDRGNNDDEEGVGCMAVGNKASDNNGALIGIGEATGTAINGLHAVYATEFYTCAMDGAMRGWRYVQEGTVHDGYTMEGAQHRRNDSDTRVERMLGGMAAFVPVIEAEADMRVTYGGLNAAVSMAGVEHYMAVVHEEGQMRIYMSA